MLHQDVSVQQQPVLCQEVSGPQQPLLHQDVSVCIVLNTDVPVYKNLCCTCTCVFTAHGSICIQELASAAPLRSVYKSYCAETDVSIPKSMCCTCTCAFVPHLDVPDYKNLCFTYARLSTRAFCYPGTFQTTSPHGVVWSTKDFSVFRFCSK